VDGRRRRAHDRSVSDQIQNIKDAVELECNCSARHVESVVVIEMSGGKTIWEGMVEVFALVDHPEAKRCYAWSFMDGHGRQYVTLLEKPPVTSPNAAVRAAIASGQQK
jgi:hypothetical protein